jgi:hypothetical protein
MYKCLECGAVFEEPKFYKESRPYGSGFAFEELSGCPSCGEGFENAYKCDSCGEYFTRDEMIDGVCKDCIEDVVSRNKNNLKSCFLMCKDEEKVSVEINLFLSEMFSQSQIEEILIKELLVTSAFGLVDCSKFLNDNVELLVEKIKSGEVE